MKRSIRESLLVAACLLALPAAGHAQISDNKVKIGFLLDMSGPFSSLNGPGTVAAAELAVEDFGGKVLDKPIEIVAVDMQNKPDLASGGARRFFDSEQVDAILDNNGTAISITNMSAQETRCHQSGKWCAYQAVQGGRHWVS